MHWLRHRLAFCLLVALGAASTACAVDVAPQSLGTTSSELYAVDDLWSGGEVRVCWEDTSPEYLRQREWVRDQVEKTWAREGNIVFRGWGQCGSVLAAEAEVRIGISDERPSSTVGPLQHHIYSGMTLNFTEQVWSPSEGNPPATDQALEFDVRAIAAHEFGHALGYKHEQARPDAPDTCDAEGWRSEGGDTLLTAYDMQSIMGYCTNPWNNNGVLSPLDILGVHKSYGKRRSSMLGATNAKCVLPDNPSAGAILTQTSCLRTADETVWIGPGNQIRTGSSNYCMHSTGTKGSVVTAQTCLYESIPSKGLPPPPIAAQKWRFAETQLRGIGGKCLRLHRGTTAKRRLPVFEATLQKCDLADPEQRFDFEPSQSAVKISKSGSCLTADATGRLSADSQDCSLTFSLANGGYLQTADNRCLDVADETTNDGTPVRLSTCAGSVRQVFSAVGQLRDFKGLCLNSGSAFLSKGSPLVLTSCFDAPATRWELFQ